MKLPLASRARVALSRRALDWIVRSPRVAARLGRDRRATPRSSGLDPVVAALIAVDELDAGSDLSRLPAPRARQKFAEQLAIVEAEGPALATEELRFEGPRGPLRARRYRPASPGAGLPAIVFFHGGGFLVGDLDSHDGLCRFLAHGAGCQLIAIAYRLAPEHPFPAPVEDALAALAWVFDEAERLGVDPRRVAVAGDSAGGNLSAVTSLRFRARAHRPALQVLFYPATDATASLPSQARLGEGYILTRRMLDHYYDTYLGTDGANRRHPDASPLFEPDVSGAPPAIVWVAGFDPLRDEGVAYAERLERAGVPVQLREFASLPHGFVSMTRALPEMQVALTELGRLIAAKLGP